MFGRGERRCARHGVRIPEADQGQSKCADTVVEIFLSEGPCRESLLRWNHARSAEGLDAISHSSELFESIGEMSQSRE